MDKSIIKGVTKMFAPYKATVVLVVLVCLLQGVIDNANPFLLKFLSEHELTEERIIVAAIVSVITIALSFFIKRVTTYTLSIVLDNILEDLRLKIFKHYEELDYSFHSENKIGSTFTLITNDVKTLDHFLYSTITVVFRLIIQMIIALSIISNINTIILLSILPLLIFLSIFEIVHLKHIRKAFRKIRKESEKMNQFIEDRFSGIHTVISYNKEKAEYINLFNIVKNVNKKRKYKWKLLYLHYSVYMCGIKSIFSITIVLGAYFVYTGRLSMTECLLFYSLTRLIVEPFDTLNSITDIFQEGYVSYHKIREFLETEPAVKNSKDNIRIEEKLEGDIEFNNVSFHYPDNNENIIEDFNFTIKQGDYVAFIGESGIGKSTIANLIPRFYDTTNGSITIGGINIKDYNLGELRRHIGIVSQDYYIFHGTVYDNIVYGKVNASIEEVIAAAKKANAHKFISELSNGYNSDIGEKGIKLSGGQKQRIVLARIFLMDPDIYIFDEATSALDNESEKAIQEAMEIASTNKTVISIAHRLSTIEKANKIVVLGKGNGNNIKECGTHEELIEQKGYYYRMLNRDFN